MTIPEHVRLVAAQDWVARVTAAEEWNEAEYEAWERAEVSMPLMVPLSLASILCLLVALVLWGMV